MSDVLNSASRGFVLQGTTIPFSFGVPSLGFGEGAWSGAEFRADQGLDDFLAQVVGGVTGIYGDLVRPRFQPEPPDLPPIGTDWVAAGVFGEARPQGYPYGEERPTPSGLGHRAGADWEEFDLLASFYGPNAGRNATILREGLYVAQNLEPLALADIVLVGVGSRRRLTDLIQRKYMERYDVLVTLTRTIATSYPILYFLTAPISVITDTGATSDRTVTDQG